MLLKKKYNCIFISMTDDHVKTQFQFKYVLQNYVYTFS